MDELFVLAFLMMIVVPVALILGVIGFFGNNALKRRVAELEQTVADLKRGVALPEAPQPMAPESAEPQPAAAPQPWPAIEQQEPAVSEPVAGPPGVPDAVPVATAAAPPRDLESALGTRWAVWVGGLALALGGLFLVRYSIEQGFIGPEMRIVLGALLGLGLLAGGEILRRRGFSAGVPGLAMADIPSILIAAGSSTLFGTAFAAHALYDFLGPTATVLALVVVALGTVLLALWHAPWLAGLGLLGGYVAPLLVGSESPNMWPVVALAGVLTATGFGLARLKGWTPLARLSLVAHLAWGVLFVMAPASARDIALIAHSGALIAIAILFASFRHPVLLRPRRPHRWLAHWAAIGAALLVAADVSAGTLTVPVLVAAGAVVVALALAAAYAPGLRAFALIGAVLAMAIVGAFEAIVPVLRDGLWVDPRDLGVVARSSVDRVLLTAGAFAALFGIGGLWAALRIGDPRLALAAAGAPVALLAATALRFRLLDFDVAFGIAALALAALLAAVTEMLVRRAPAGRSAETIVGIYAASSAAAVGLAIAFLVPGTQLPLGFAAAALGIALVATVRPIPLLRAAVAAAALMSIAALLYDPDRLLRPAVDAWPFLNTLGWSLGVPAVLLAAAAFVLARGGRADVPRTIVEGVASVLALAYLWRASEHAFLAPINGRIADELGGLGLRAVLMVAAALTFERLHRVAGGLVYAFAAFAAYALAMLGVVTLVALHPYVEGRGIVGGTLLNNLLTAYLGPAIVAFALALRERRGGGTPVTARAFEVAGHILLVAYLVAEIGVLFRGVGLAGRIRDAEAWAYSALGLAYAVVLLGIGLVRDKRTLRLVSGALLVLVVVKVFVFDLAGLQGLWRALSFIGLGLVLVAIGLVYQRLLARQQQPGPPRPS